LKDWSKRRQKPIDRYWRPAILMLKNVVQNKVIFARKMHYKTMTIKFRRSLKIAETLATQGKIFFQHVDILSSS
jgi:hypothetical protein